MTRVVIVGEIYNADLYPGGGPMPGGPNYPSGGPVYPGGPTDPGYGRPGWSPVDPGWGQGHPGGHPGNRPPGSWDGTHPGNWVPGSGEYPSGGPIAPPRGGTDVPADEYAPLPPPENIYSQYVVSVWDPKAAAWTTKTYPPR